MTRGHRRRRCSLAAALAAVTALPAGAAAQALFPFSPSEALTIESRDAGCGTRDASDRTRDVSMDGQCLTPRVPRPASRVPGSFTLRPALLFGGGTLAFGAPPGPAMTVGGDVRLESVRARLVVAGDARMSRFVDNPGGSSRWTFSSLLRSPDLYGVRGELLGAASALNHRGYGATRRYELRAGPAAERSPYAAALRGNVARVWAGNGWRAVTGGDLYLQRTVAAGVVTLSAARAAFGDSARVVRDTVYEVAGFSFRGKRDVIARRRRHYLDLEAALHWPARRVALELVAGARHGDSTTEGERWVRLRAVAPLTPQLALVAEGGRQPAVPEQLVPSGRFAALAMRLAPGARRPPARPGLPPAASSGARAAGPTVLLVEAAAGARMLQVTGLAAERVEMMGDFTDWTPVPLERVGPDGWRFPRAIPSGAHHVVLRVNGGPWQPPPGLPMGADEFAGDVGVLLVE